MAKGQGLQKAGTEAAEPAATKSPNFIPAYPSSTLQPVPPASSGASHHLYAILSNLPLFITSFRSILEHAQIFPCLKTNKQTNTHLHIPSVTTLPFLLPFTAKLLCLLPAPPLTPAWLLPAKICWACSCPITKNNRRLAVHPGADLLCLWTSSVQVRNER